MNPFKATQSTNNKILHLTLEGEIQGSCELPQLEMTDVSELDFDIGKITYINSGGIRNWIIWMSDLSKKFPNVSFVFRQIPPIMVSQITNVDLFIPKKAKIKSVFIPFFCDHCGATSTRLFEPEKYFEQSKTKEEILALMCDMSCPQCSKPMEMDAFPEKYLTCLEQHRGN